MKPLFSALPLVFAKTLEKETGDNLKRRFQTLVLRVALKREGDQLLDEIGIAHATRFPKFWIHASPV